MEHLTPSIFKWKFPETQSAGDPLFSFLFSGKPALAQSRCHLPYTKQLSRHTGTGWSGGGGGSSTRGRTDSDGAEQRPPGRPLLCLPERAVCAAPSGAQGSVAARGRAAAVASRRAARARRGGQVIGRRVMGRRVTAPSDRRRANRRSAAADLEGVRSATVGVGGRPSCGGEGGRQVRVARVALHQPVERTVASVNEGR